MTSAPSHHASRWQDTPRRFGRISRILHWAMALLFVWQFAGMIAKVALGWSPRESFLVGSHTQAGFVLFVLLIVRVLWALANVRNRPSYGASALGRAAAAGHVVLYALMLLVPALALLRAWGSGRGFRFLDSVVIVPAGGTQQWLADFVNSTNDSLGGSLHGLIGWLLLLVIVGHIGMVVVHHFIWRDDTAHKMIGPSKL